MNTVVKLAFVGTLGLAIGLLGTHLRERPLARHDGEISALRQQVAALRTRAEQKDKEVFLASRAATLRVVDAIIEEYRQAGDYARTLYYTELRQELLGGAD